MSTATDQPTTGKAGDEHHLLEVTDLRTSFKTGRGMVRAVDGLSLSVERGKTLGLVGESGSGKSVTSRSIMGLTPRRNVERSGTVRLGGRDITDLSEAEYRELWATEMAMIFQDPMTALNPVTKVGNQIAESMRVHLDLSKSEARERTLALLEAVRIPEAHKRIDVYPHEMSGGMRQRVVIAIALACGPKLLFADEPTTALDVTVQAQVLDLLAEQQRERYMGMILVTHDLGVVASRADEIAVMYAGRIVERAPTRVLFREMKMPYTEALLAAIPKLEMAPHTRLVAIGGRPPDLVNPPEGCSFSPRCPYVQDRCRTEQPELVESPTTAGHFYACHFPVGSPENDEIRVQLRKSGVSLPGDEVAVTAAPGGAQPSVRAQLADTADEAQQQRQSTQANDSSTSTKEA
ncbi:MAG: ABC transporter ATP-binding protein [Microthrixaceae bacterium]